MKQYYSYLESQQGKDGGFLDVGNLPSVFHTALILACLNRAGQNPLGEEIKRRAVGFLLSRKDADWKFSGEAGIDFCALAALADYDKDLIDGEAVAKILIGLTSLESQEGGPYFSWAGGKHIDLAANASIANFLSIEGVELPELTKLFEDAIGSKNFRSESFASGYPAAYFIAKFYKGGRQRELAEFIREKNDSERENLSQSEILLSLNALLDIGHPDGKSQAVFDYVEDFIKKPDSRYVFYTDKNGLRVESTLALNMALYLEASNKRNLPDAGKPSRNQDAPGRSLDGQEKEMMDRIMEAAGKRFADLPNEVRDLAGREIRKTISGNRDNQMSLMAYYMKKSLGKKADAILDSVVAEMGLANVFFWTAFIIYDDFWDEDEAADTSVLPVANLYARSYVDFFSRLLPPDTGFNGFFHGLMDKSDAANTWENIHCRTKVEGSKFFIPEKLPDYGDYDLKYRPASGQVLGPVAMLVLLGYRLDSSEVENLVAYFKNYLIAMQINDDAHDWEEDMRRGHLSTVVTLLLQDLDWPEKVIDLETDLEELKKVFWFKTIKRAAQAAVSYTEKSRHALNAMESLEDTAPLEKIITAAESVARKALKEQADTESFLRTYG